MMNATVRVIEPDSVKVSAEIEMTLGEWVEVYAALEHYSRNVKYSSVVYGLRSLIDKVIRAARDKVDVNYTETRP